MNALVVLAHPKPGSLNHAIASAVRQAIEGLGHEVFYHDLYLEGFDPVLPADEIPRDGSLPDSIKVHCDQLANADLIIIVHPNWWGQPPAILKGWIDRVVRPGGAYAFEEGDSGEGVPRGLLKARVALVFNTGNTPAAREKEVFGDPLELLWHNCVFRLCGVKRFRRRLYGVVASSTAEQREAWLEDARKLVREEMSSIPPE